MVKMEEKENHKSKKKSMKGGLMRKGIKKRKKGKLQKEK